MIAVSRKVIILDMKDTSAESMVGIALLLFSLAGSYYLIKKGMRIPMALPNQQVDRDVNES